MDESGFCSCPYCESIFKLPAEKLKHRAGMVRCGACREVFDANDNLMIKTKDGYSPVAGAFLKQEVVIGEDIGEDNISNDVNFERDHEEISVSITIPSRNTYEDSMNVDLYNSQQLPSEHPNDEFSYSGINLGRQRDRNEPVEEIENPFEKHSENPFETGGASEPQPPESLESLMDSDMDSDMDSEPIIDMNMGIDDESWQFGKGVDLQNSILSRREPVDSESNLFDMHLDASESLIEDSHQSAPSAGSGFSDTDNTRLDVMSRSNAQAYINDRSNPFMTFIWMLVSLSFVFLLGMQIKYFFVGQYAQDDSFRNYLVGFCKIAGCALPPRKEPFLFTLTHTKIDLHPSHPGALRVTVKLVNEAEFAQPYPWLRLTLTDRVGRVVGRRTFPPALYLQSESHVMVNAGELATVLFDLARPHEKAVGFEIDIVADGVTNSISSNI